MLAFTVGRSTASLCRPVQLHLCGGKVPLGRVTARRVGWKRFVSGDAKTVRAIPVENVGGVRAALRGDGVGRAILGGGALFGVGSLCFYGLGLSGETGAIDRAGFWPEHIRQRVNSTYTYFATGLSVTSVAAFAATRTTSVMRFMAGRPVASMLLFVVGTIGSSMLCYATPYTPETLPAKIGAFILFTSIMGVTMAPLISIAGPLVGRAALYTAGVVGGLTAACAPSDKYLKWGGPLALGLGVVFVSSIGGMFAAPGGAVFSALHTVYMYGGLVLFGGFLLYDTQKIVYHAEHDHHYDPINM
jgi:FtsH-binding integral membrane protein